MNKLRSGVLVTVTLLIGLVLGSGVAAADPPAAGDSCTVFHATTEDAHGRTMWCNPTMTGEHTLVWQYGGPE
ncbi:hypothetical protein [Mycobacterium kubicae]|uniref:Secreted protein n=1 Tax=Mycobacterium kubicae TaxID=120959 RepID=A0AAX1J5U4_9MYCO|nr:hypothetical protein [Mycobacterium kubicae]MCV7097673.1 hypothetical protein [Mycobacterium kubicae]QNI13282.1 hypothetical protein GAN18_20760 [Mycobacterium kubicae]QPI36801.1 hypothetical protein I2456_20430 [Mycobacterium kubicae]